VAAGRAWAQWLLNAIAGACFIFALVFLEPVAPIDEAFPDAIEYVETARNLVDGDGYKTDTRPDPRYPPGLPLLLVPFVALNEPPDDVQHFPALAGALLLVAMGASAWSLGGRVAAASTWLIAALSRGVTGSTAQILSDLPAAVLVCAALACVARRRDLWAGILVGFSATVRLGHAAFALAVPRYRGWVGAALVLGPLALVQLWLFGNLSGYADGTAEFGLAWLHERPIRGANKLAAQPNPEFYLQQLAGREWWLVPGTAAVALLELWFRRGESVARFAAGVICLNLTTYFLYFYQDARFVLTSTVLLTVFAGAAVARGLRAAKSTLWAKPEPSELHTAP
jgi:hypothetical protein